jgi:cysteinyl-tRNA synthetase
MNFSIQSLHEAANNVASLRDLAEKLQLTVASVDEAAGENERPLEPADQKMLDEFARAMDDDLNIAGALGALFAWTTPLNKSGGGQKKIPYPQARSALTTLKKIDHILGVIFPPLRGLDLETTAKIEALITQRDQARAAKDWPKSDELRKQLAALNVEVKDAPTGSTWRPRLAPQGNL